MNIERIGTAPPVLSIVWNLGHGPLFESAVPRFEMQTCLIQISTGRKNPLFSAGPGSAPDVVPIRWLLMISTKQPHSRN
jgi:hypothetical protein